MFGLVHMQTRVLSACGPVWYGIKYMQADEVDRFSKMSQEQVGGKSFFVVFFKNMCVYVQSRFPVSGHISSSCMMKYCFSGPQIVERTV